jgi:hypothetical protein
MGLRQWQLFVAGTKGGVVATSAIAVESSAMAAVVAWLGVCGAAISVAAVAASVVAGMVDGVVATLAAVIVAAAIAAVVAVLGVV